MALLQSLGPWIVASASLLAAIMAGVFTYVSRKPDRMELITDGAWKLKGEAERQLATALARISELEAQVRATADRLSSVEAAHAAEILAQRKLHIAEMEAKQVLHDADMAAKDGIILRLTEKVDALELRINQMNLPVVQVSTTETTTTTTRPKQ